MLKLRLSNQIDWACDFQAKSEQELSSGCQFAWREFIRNKGISSQRLYLQVNVTGTSEWSTSGQYTLLGNHNLPPQDHEVFSSQEKNDFSGLFAAVSMSAEHASMFEGLSIFVTTPTEKEVSKRRSNFKVVSK